MLDTYKSTEMATGRQITKTSMVVSKSQPATSILKRIVDICVSGAAILFLLPALLLIALLIKVDSAGPVLFRQRRTGLNGRIFSIYKFRSMTVAEDGDKVVQAKQNDQRVTNVGRLLRRTSLDEIPQLLNILLGDMSLVGPRPHARAHDDEFVKTVQKYNDRFRAKPGLTGLAQVRGYRGEIVTRDDIEKRIEYDNEYIENWSIGMDITTIVMTVPCLFGHKNAY